MPPCNWLPDSVVAQRRLEGHRLQHCAEEVHFSYCFFSISSRLYEARALLHTFSRPIMIYTALCCKTSLCGCYTALGRKQFPVPLGTDLHGVVDHFDGGLVVHRIRRTCDLDSRPPISLRRPWYSPAGARDPGAERSRSQRLPASHRHGWVASTRRS